MEVVWKYLPGMLEGAVLTIELSVLSLAIGLVCAVPLALLRLSANPLLWVPAYGYIFYFRGTPLLVQIFMIYHGASQFIEELEMLGLWQFFQDAWFCAVLSLTLNTAGYTAEILRGAIQAVPHGEIEAARASGMSKIKAYRRIILPKAFRLALPAYGNEVVFLLQATSLVSIITLMELMGVARTAVARSFAPFELYMAAGVIYLGITYSILFVFKKVEFRLSGHLRDRKEAMTEAADGAIAR